MVFIKVCDLSEIKKGSSKIVKPGSHEIDEIALFNIDGTIYAISNKCPHSGGPLGEGDIENGIVACPWHGWKFDVKTGQNIFMPIKVRTFNVKIENGSVMVDI